MKITKTCKAVMLGLSLLLAVSAFASTKGSMMLLDNVMVGNQSLKAGDYSVKWDGTGPNIQLSIMKGSKVVATTPARLVDSPQSSSNDESITTTNPDGTKTLSGLQLAGKKYTIQIGQESADAGTK